MAIMSDANILYPIDSIIPRLAFIWEDALKVDTMMTMRQERILPSEEDHDHDHDQLKEEEEVIREIVEKRAQ
jgi:hypothetical protein